MGFEPSRSDKIRTCDPFVPNEVRYQLRYTPIPSFLLANAIISIVHGKIKVTFVQKDFTEEMPGK